MCDLKTIGIEAWPVAADTEAIWLAGRDAWRFGPLPADTTVHFETQRLLLDHGIDPDDALFVRIPEGAPQASVIHGRPKGLRYVETENALGRGKATVP